MLPAWPRIRNVAALRAISHSTWVRPRNECWTPARRSFQHSTSHLENETSAPLRKHLKDAVKTARLSKNTLGASQTQHSGKHDGWQLTVGIEIHAQLNSPQKLFSSSLVGNVNEPNTQLSHFDLALPGSQPVFQVANLIPAIRAAVALRCNIQHESRFDRKHYFYHDQPSGYQITQYYAPFAKDGLLTLRASDGLAPEDGEELGVGIKQVQMEQDTARTQEQDHETSLIDFNRAGQALIEIISMPHIHSPQAAAAYVRKVQSILFAVDAVTTGMEMGGLRADVNVSVRRRDVRGTRSYGNVRGLGQRTEIKNLSSIRGVEDAVRAEMKRQITVLEAGGVIEGETRGWSITNPGETRRLRGKEGEVDYRYMPDPDLLPLRISSQLVDHLDANLPPVPDDLRQMLVDDYGLLDIDARILLDLDNGERLIYYQDVVDLVDNNTAEGQRMTRSELGKSVGSWVLHELGALLSTSERLWSPTLVRPSDMANIIRLLRDGNITNSSAKKVLRAVFEGDASGVDQIVKRDRLSFNAMSDEEYEDLAREVMEAHVAEVADIRHKKKEGKLMFLVGQMVRRGDKGRIEASRAQNVLRRLVMEAPHDEPTKP